MTFSQLQVGPLLRIWECHPVFLDGLEQLLFPFLWLIDFVVEGRRERQYPRYSVIDDL